MNIRIAESLEGHSGFAFPKPISVLLQNLMVLNPFMGTEPCYHDFHHEKNVGNYSSLYTIWDTVLGSNIKYYEMKIKEEQINELAKNKLR